MIPILQGLSLRVRLLIALTCAVVPFATVLMFANLWIYQPLQDEIQPLSDAIQARFEEISNLQLMLARSAMPPNDFLLHGREDERVRFALLAGRVESLLISLARSTDREHPEESAKVLVLQQRWAEVRAMGERLLQWPAETRLGEGAVAMERFDREIELLAEGAESLLAHVRAELEEARMRAIKRRHDLNRFVALSTTVAGILTLLMVAYIARVLLGPLGASRATLARSEPLPPRPRPVGVEGLGGDAPSVPAGDDGKPPTGFGLDLAIDPVTGLWSRRSLNLQLATETERAMVLETPSSLLILELDQHREIAERSGQGVANGVLVAVAERIRHVIRQTDFPCRSGPAEFAVLMPATDIGRAAQIAERIRQHVAEKPVAADGCSLAVTVSAGVAGDVSARSGHAGASTLLGRADQALFRARRAGGNHVELAGGARPDSSAG